MIQIISSFGRRNRDVLSRLSIILFFFWGALMLVTALVGSDSSVDSDIWSIGMRIVTTAGIAMFFLAHPSAEDRAKVNPVHVLAWFGGQIFSLGSFAYVAGLS